MEEAEKSTTQRKRRSGPSRKLLRWHRRLGTVFSIIFLMICTTGILLNHTEALKLSQKTIGNETLLSWYGMQPNNAIQTYQLETDHISFLENTLYFNGLEIGSIKDFVSIAATTEVILAAGSNEALLLTRNGDVIEILRENGIPSGEIQKAGTTPRERIVLETSEGRFVADNDFLSWDPFEGDSKIKYLNTVPTPAEINSQILKSYRGDGLSLYRIILDLHSGRFFGGFGTLIADLTAFVLIFLTLSGLYYSFFLRRR